MIIVRMCIEFLISMSFFFFSKNIVYNIYWVDILLEY